MPIIINHNLCDEAPECGGIEVCPTGAFHYDKKRRRVAIDHSKCNECLLCTMPDACPVGCILFARNKKSEKKIREMIKEDPRTAKWLWKERYGTQPGKTSPMAAIINHKNLSKILKKKGYKLIDIWHNDFLDCRVNATLFTDILKNIKKEINIYKLDAQQFTDYVEVLNTKKFPSLLLYKDNKEIWRFEGLLQKKDVGKIQKELESKIK